MNRKHLRLVTTSRVVVVIVVVVVVFGFFFSYPPFKFLFIKMELYFSFHIILLENPALGTATRERVLHNWT